jgi:broad specificity phosphatase PhoE
MPEVVPGVASTLWRLSESAREDCVLLAHALPANLGSPVLTSGQPKADETAAIVALRRGLQVRMEPRVRETDEPPGWFEGDFRALVARYLEGDVPPGWEPHAAVVTRFNAAVEDGVAALPEGQDLVIATHGRAPSLYLASLKPAIVHHGRTLPFELVPFWRALTFPDAWRLDVEANTLERLFTAGVAPGV